MAIEMQEAPSKTGVETKWKVDPAHSEVQFKVKHLMITTVTGHFKNFDLEVETEGDDSFPRLQAMDSSDPQCANDELGR